MRKVWLFFAFIFIRSLLYAQYCSTTDASGCRCQDTSQLNCDLLPDVTVSSQALTDSGGYKEYPQIGPPGQGADDGRLRLSVAVPNIGIGPLDLRPTNFFVCGPDTIIGNPNVCLDGSQPKELIEQRIYHKSQDSMTYSSRLAGSVTYHPLHGHFHVDNWSLYTLRIKKPGEPDPRRWPIVGRATKNSFCLENEATCSGRPGYCRDTNNVILLDSNFRNSSLGTYFTCTPGSQGISSGYYDEYYKEYYGMWIDIPAGTCNGDYYIVVEVDPLNLFIESNEKNNWIAVPVKLTRQDTAGNAGAVITPGGLTTICQGDSLRLTATAAYSYSWSTGDTVQTITVKNAGSYSVTLTSPCGTAASAPFQVTVLSSPAAPAGQGDTVCPGDSARLGAAGTDSTYWYNVPAGGKALKAGPSFVTPTLASSTTFYAEDVRRTPGLNLIAGKPDSGAAGRYYAAHGFYSHLLFDCISAFTLNAVTLYASDTGWAAITLYDWDGYQLKQFNARVSKGKNRVPLNFQIFPGDNYCLGLKGDSIYYGDSANIHYPYEVPGVLSIRRSSMSKKDYPFFYKWEIKTADILCRSPRTAVTAVVDTACTTGTENLERMLPRVDIYPHPLHSHSVFRLDKYSAPYSFDLYDLFGRPVLRKELITASSFAVDRNDLFPGMYIYKLCFKNGMTVTGKLVVQ